MNSESILKTLAKSKFRSSFHLKDKDINYVKEKGIEIISKHAYDLISKRIGDKNPVNDGKQTPMKGHPVFIAQHATATCCRSCLYKWHKIPQNKELNENEKKYIVNIIMKWIDLELKKGKNYVRTKKN